MLNNSAPRKHVFTSQHEHLSNYGGLEVGRGQAMSSQRTHENQSRHDGREFAEASSTTSGSSMFENLWRLGGRNEQGDGKRC